MYGEENKLVIYVKICAVLKKDFDKLDQPRLLQKSP